MEDIQLGFFESKFAEIIWQREPVTSTELVKLGNQEFGWKRTTVHTVLRRLCDKGLFKNENGTVTALLSRDGFYAMQSRRFVEETFHGSLPDFLAAFGSGKKLSHTEIEELQRIIEDMRG